MVDFDRELRYIKRLACKNSYEETEVAMMVEKRKKNEKKSLLPNLGNLCFQLVCLILAFFLLK